MEISTHLPDYEGKKTEDTPVIWTLIVQNSTLGSDVDFETHPYVYVYILSTKQIAPSIPKVGSPIRAE
jgi:hypothetical protein